MIDWQDKYRDLEVGQSAWYWHKENKVKYPKWEAVRVQRQISTQDSCEVLVFRNIFSEEIGVVSEDFPNGPKCTTPDDVIVLAEELLSINRVLRKEGKWK